MLWLIIGIVVGAIVTATILVVVIFRRRVTSKRKQVRRMSVLFSPSANLASDQTRQTAPMQELTAEPRNRMPVLNPVYDAIPEPFPTSRRAAL